MLQICILVLVLQIGFNAALNNGGYSNPLIPQSRSVRYAQSRRSSNSYRYQPEIYERSESSENEETDSEETSVDQTKYQSQSSYTYLPYPKNPLRYDTRSINDVSLETPPVGRVGFSYKSDVSTSQEDTDYRRPYLRNKQLNLKRTQNRKYRKKGDSDDSPVNSLVAATAGEDANCLRSLLSLVEQPNLRRDQSRKYYRKGADLSIEISPNSYETDDDDTSSSSSRADTPFLDSLLSSLEYRRIGKNLDKLRSNKLLLDNDNDDTSTNSRQSLWSKLPSSYYRRNNRKNNRYSDYNVRYQMPSETYHPNAYSDTILRTSGKGKPDDDDIFYARSQLRNSGRMNLRKTKKYNRRYDDSSTFELSSDDRLSADEDNFNELPAFREPKTNLRNRKQPNLRNNDNNVGIEPNNRLSPDDDYNDKITVLSLASLADSNLQSPHLRGREQQKQNKEYKVRSFLRLALSPNDKLSLDEDMASSLSDLLSENLDNLKLVPVNLRSSKAKNWKDSRRIYDDLSLDIKISSEDDNLENISIDGINDLSIESPAMRNYNPTKNENSIRTDENTGLNFLLTDTLMNNVNPVDDLVPYHEFTLSNKTSNNTWNNKQNSTRNNNQELNLPQQNYRKFDSKAVLPLFDKFELDDDSKEGSTVLRLDYFNSETLSESSNEDQTHEHGNTDVIHLEFPWNGQFSLGDIQSNKPVSTNKSESRLRSCDRTDTINDPKNSELELEFPWNDHLSADDKSDKDLASRGLRNLEKTDKQNADPKDYELTLEFSWNDQQTPDDKNAEDLTNDGLRNNKQTYSQDSQSVDPQDYDIELEFPWDGEPPPDEKNDNDLTNRGLRNNKQTNRQSANPKDYEIELEFPWNDQLSPDDNSANVLTNTGLRNLKQTDRESVDPKDYELELEYPWSDDLSPDEEILRVSPVIRRNNLDSSYLRNRNRYNNSNRRQSKNKASLSDSRRETSSLRHSDGSFKKELSIRVLGIDEKDRENKTDSRVTSRLRSSYVADSSAKISPYDRRPYLRLRPQHNGYSAADVSRRAYTPLSTTASSSEVVRVGTFNDTILFPEH